MPQSGLFRELQEQMWEYYFLLAIMLKELDNPNEIK
jgi:hypothetical protein